jgi:hypothetical protein
MITSKITNIILEGDRIRVFLELSNDVKESFLFLPESVASDILTWKSGREEYFNLLEQKVEDLKQELIEE